MKRLLSVAILALALGCQNNPQAPQAMMEVRYNPLVSRGDTEKWADVARKIWQDILSEDPSLRHPQDPILLPFTFEVRTPEEMKPSLGVTYLTFKDEGIEVSVLVQGSREERQVVEAIAHELDHVRTFLNGESWRCVSYDPFLLITDPKVYQDYLNDFCEVHARAFSARYLQQTPEILAEVS